MAVDAYSWTRDSHGLYDYENKIAVKSAFSVSEAGFIYRTDNECFFSNMHEESALPLAEVFSYKGKL